MGRKGLCACDGDWRYSGAHVPAVWAVISSLSSCLPLSISHLHPVQRPCADDSIACHLLSRLIPSSPTHPIWSCSHPILCLSITSRSVQPCPCLSLPVQPCLADCPGRDHSAPRELRRLPRTPVAGRTAPVHRRHPNHPPGRGPDSVRPLRRARHEHGAPAALGQVRSARAAIPHKPGRQ